MLAILEADNRISRVERVPMHVRESSRGHLLSGNEEDVPGRERAGSELVPMRAPGELDGEGTVATAQKVAINKGHTWHLMIRS